VSDFPIALRWGMACGAILNQMHDADHRMLGGRAPGPAATAECKRILSSWWGVSTEEELHDTLDWLRGEGHRDAWNDLADEVRDFGLDPDDAPDGDDEDEVEEWRKKQLVAAWAPRIGARSLYAWDACRLVSVVGWAAHAHLLPLGTAWSEIMGAARKLQATHSSWAEVGQLYALGKQFWRAGPDAELDEALAALASSPTSPWRELPWSTPLVAAGVTPRDWDD
jgi:hypothetical protein